MCRRAACAVVDRSHPATALDDRERDEETQGPDGSERDGLDDPTALDTRRSRSRSRPERRPTNVASSRRVSHLLTARAAESRTP